MLSTATGPKPIQSGGVKTVVIDAGHGGKDPGNLGTGRYKTKEKDIALKVSLLVGRYISENLKDVKVIFTRTEDVKIPLEERAAIANRAKADLFISIHADSFEKSSVHGCQSIVLGRNHDDDNLRVAMKENAVIFLEEDYEEKYDGFDPKDPTSYISFSLYQSTHMDQSVSFAAKVQDQFRDRVGRKDRGVKQQPLMVTKMATMPSALIELGFLTNPAEEDFLNSEKGQSYMASAIYRAFKEYKIEVENFTPGTIPVNDTPPVKTPNIASPAKLIAKPEVFFTVQIATSTKNKELVPQNFKGAEGISMYEDKGVYKYTYGHTQDLEQAKALQAHAKELGFKDAFVIGMASGKRVTLREASDLLQ